MTRDMDIQSIPGRPFEFTRNWFRNRNLATFRTHVYPYWKDKKANILEIGVFEGACLIWMLQYLHQENRIWGVDPWLETTKIDPETMDDIRRRALRNTEPFGTRCTLIRANSVEALSRASTRRGFYGLKKDTLDLCVIDGDHSELGMWNDARKALPIVKPGGHLLFDDVENRIKKKQHVKDGLARFLEESGDAVKLIWKDRFMECYQKQ